MTIGSQTLTISPVLVRTCASTHFSRITSNALIFFDAATPLLHLSLWSLKTCRIFAALASPTSSPRNPTTLPQPPQLRPSRTPTTTPTRLQNPPSLPLLRQDHSTLLTGLLLLALSNIPASHDVGISNACTTQISPLLPNRSLTSIGLFMGSTVGILYLRFGPSVFPSTLHFQPTLLSMDALSSWNSPPPHLPFYLGHLHSFTTCNLLASHQFSWATSSIPTGILQPSQPVVFGKYRLRSSYVTPYPITLHRHGLRAPRT
jgi:hypothetical protein